MLKKKHKILIGLIALIIIVLVAIPIIAKNYINSNGKELIGRKVNLESLSLNYFTGGVSLGEFTIFEENDKDVFLAIKKLEVNPNITKIIGQNYVIQNVTIDGLKCNTILTDTIFNFNSIITHFDTEEEPEEKDTAAVHYAVEKLSLKNSYLSYYDKNLESKIELNNFNTSIPKGIAWNNPNINVLSDFSFVTGGKVNANFNYNLDKGIYDLNLKSKEINLSILLPYLKDFMLVKELKGALTTDMFLRGNTAESANMDIIGTFDVHNISLVDTFGVEAMALGHMEIIADSINPEKNIYQLSAIKLNHPYARYEMYPETDNFSQLLMLSDSGEVITAAEEHESNLFVMIKDYVVETLHGIKASNFSIDTVAITNVEALYIDHTMLQIFKYNVSKANLTAYNVKSNADSLIVNFNALLNNRGLLNADGILHPKKPEDVNITMTIDKMEMRDLSPYFHQYVAHPINKGVFNMKTSILVIDKKLDSKHNLLVQALTLGKKQKHPDAYNLPVKMGVAMLKDRDKNIVLDIPVEGNLGDPKYKVWKTIGRIFKELLLKAASSPYNLVAGAVDTDEESTKRINIDNLIDSLSSRHHIKLDNLVKVLTEKPELVLLIDPYYNINKEIDKMAKHKTKEEFKTLNKVNNVNVKDSLFIAFVNSKTKSENKALSITDKIKKLYPPEILRAEVESLIEHKTNYINNYLTSKGVLPSQIKKSALTGTRFDQSSNKNVQYQLQFDVDLEE
ncbi:MAG: DUF748 domain-containing protein [Vicingaceae bacterium]